MKKEVNTYVKKCPQCIVHSSRRPHLPMGEMPIPSGPGQLIVADLIGPMVESPQGNVYALTVVDHCSGWAEAFPIARKSNEEVWRKLCG